MIDSCGDRVRADHNSEVLGPISGHSVQTISVCKLVVKAIQVDDDKFLPCSVCTCGASSVFIFVAVIVEDEHQIGESVIQE